MGQSMELNLASPVFKANPYSVFAQLRTYDPVHQLATNAGQSRWLVTRYADAERILRDERFVKDRQHIASSQNMPHMATTAASFADLMEMSIVDLDPPDHTRLRTLVHPFFTPRQIETWRGRIQDIANELIDNVIEKGYMDLIEEFASILPLRII